jgi:hypothetical protein
MIDSQDKKEIRNKRLFELLETLTKALVDALDKKPFSQDYGSWYDRIKILLERDPELLAKILEKRPDLEEKKLSLCLSSANKCLKALLAENVCKNKPHASTLEEYQDELALFLEKLFGERERARTLIMNPEALERHFNDVFIREYERYENYLYNEPISNFMICPLQNFICPKNLELGNQMVIRRITQEEFHSLVEAEKRYGREPHELESYPEFVLYVPVGENDCREQIESVITSLRLVKKERIGLSKVYFSYALPIRPWKIFEAPAGTKFLRKQTGELFNLADSDYLGLNSILTLVNQKRQIGYLRMAMRRLNFAYERERLEDSWIDFFVSLESLYSKDDEMTEVTHRLATRVSRVLGGNVLKERKEIRRKIKKWYGIRSKIVHGVQVQLDQKQIEDLEEVVRNSIKWFMTHEECANHDKIIDLIDLS